MSIATSAIAFYIPVGIMCTLYSQVSLGWKPFSIMPRRVNSVDPLDKEESDVNRRVPNSYYMIQTVKLKIPGKHFRNPNPELLLHSSYSFWP